MALVIMGYPIGRLLPSIIFPVICFGSIYADWSHTREWKRQKQLQLEILESVRREEMSD